MSDLDVKALEANFEGWRAERTPGAPLSEAFELFSIEQILKDADLTDEEIDSGNIGGTDDGGVDGVYLFMNRTLVQDETEVPDPTLTVQLFIIQAKYESGFSETAVQKILSFTQDLLNYSVPVDSLTHLNSLARDAISRFRLKYDEALASPHTLSVEFHYAAKADQAPHPKVTKRVGNLKAFVMERLSAAQVGFEFWGCARLLAAARSLPKSQLSLEITKNFSTDDGAVVCLARLKSFAEFLGDSHGGIRRSILEPNVRDYQGRGNPVNADIRKTLGSSEDKEFWWLNNGITVLAKSTPSVAGNKLIVDSPEIVNGLQTSQEIFDYFTKNPDKKDERNVLVRVLVPPDEQTRTRITKATNFQTSVQPVSLRATDQIHFDIEERFKLHGLFYDRKKGKYRNLRKPIAQIVSIRSLAQAVIAVVLQRPDDARARPQSLLNREETYKQIFDDTCNRDVYVACVKIDRAVQEFFRGTDAFSREQKRDLRYYVDMWLCCQMLQAAHPNVPEIAGSTAALAGVSPDTIAAIAEEIRTVYDELGGTDKVAKGTELREAIVKMLESRFPESAKQGPA